MQFNFILPEGVSSSCTPLSNTGESIMVGPERIDQTSPKLQAFKPSEGLSPIDVKKDGSNLPVHIILVAKGWCFVHLMLFLLNLPL